MKIRAAKWQKRPRHALIVAGRVKKRNLRKESDTCQITAVVKIKVPLSLEEVSP